MIQAAMVGCAHIHTPGFVKRLLARSASVKVKRVWDPNRARARKRAAELSTQAVSTADAIWNDPEITAVVITSETDRHARAGRRGGQGAASTCSSRSRWGSAPPTPSRWRGRSTRPGVTFQTGYFMRGQPINRFLREQVQRGAFGKITRVRASNCHAGALEDWFTPEWKWMTDPKRSGCGGFGDLGTHMLDILMWIFGDVDSVAAATAGAAQALRRFLRRDGRRAAALPQRRARQPGGRLGRRRQSRDAGDQRHRRALPGSSTGSSTSRASGSGAPTARSPGPTCPRRCPTPSSSSSTPSKARKVPLVSAGEAAARSAVVEAFYEAARSGKWVKAARAG